MAQEQSDQILVAIRMTLRIRDSKVRNTDTPDGRRLVLSEHIYRVQPQKTPYKNIIIFRNIQYFFVKFTDVIRETFSH